jgi:predicted NUDIX family NTP pyrophosphohydrolase
MAASAPKLSAGLLVYRQGPEGLEVLLAHPGGPFFRNKDDGAWTIPKGAPAPGEDLVTAALREFGEEVGLPVAPPFVPLGDVRQKGGKLVAAFACAGDAPAGFTPASNSFELEWPPRSGRRQLFPEVDRAQFFPLEIARRKINPAQVALIDRLEATLAG